MKKLSLLIFSIFIFSCGVQKKAAKDLYAGIYEITVFDVDQIGDVPLTLTIIKNETGYSSQLDMRGDAAESGDYTWEVEETKIEDEIITIEAIIASYDVNFELSIEGDEISGAMMGMFDVEGSRVQPQ
jgi:hypothetical protein|tara:strand:+ start:371 stop:754 length:384 start_codon:yes stop_codon:yes gene_type:complete